MDDLALSHEQASLNVRALTEVLRDHATLRPESPALSYLTFSGASEKTRSLTFGDLDARAMKVAAILHRLAAPGARVVLVYPSSLDFVVAFLGCLYAGMIAVPVAPPIGGRGHHIKAIATDCAAHLMLCADEYLLAGCANCPEDCLVIAQIAVDGEKAQLPSACELDPVSIAFLQYTSGSTARPKGVEITHAALVANLAQIRSAFALGLESVCVNWLPLHHDMGLIGTVLEPLFCGFHAVLMSPLSFIQRPERWLRAIGQFRGTACGAPTFAYRHCVARIPKEIRASFDLSAWSVAFCGAEPVHAETLNGFAQAFAESGFRTNSFLPCYGLAEATLFVSGSPLQRGVRAIRFDAEMLDRGLAQASTNDTGHSRELVSCGVAASGTSIVIADRLGRRVEQGLVGEIRVNGPAVANGYWNRAQPPSVLSTRVPDMGDGLFLHTGDLGFVYQGELFVTGRIKDLIIIDGRNIAPEDLEISAMESCTDLLAAAAFAIAGETEDQIVMLVEVRHRRHADQLGEVLQTVRDAIAARHAVPLTALLAVRPASLPRTTSGKLSRSQCRHAYQNNALALATIGGTDAAQPLSPLGGPWLFSLGTQSNPSLRLYCFPYGGGGASAFCGWKRFFYPAVEICSVQLPGRETRSREQPLVKIDRLLQFFEQAVARHGAAPFAFFGYSLGARLAFAVARHLRQRELPLPCTMCVAAMQEPGTVTADYTPLYRMSDSELLDTLEEMLGPAWVPSQVRAHPEMLKRTLALIRSDSELGESVEFAKEAPFDFPLTVLGGRDDKFVRAEDLVRWHVHSTGGFQLHLLDGSHMLIHTQQEAIARLVASQLKPFIRV